MNIFFLDPDVRECAQAHVDKHVVKMILEYDQLLSQILLLVIWAALAVVWVIHATRHVHREERWYDYLFAAPLFVVVWVIDGVFALRRRWEHWS